MPATDKPAPIPLRAAGRPLDSASQDSVALALTLMTQFALGPPGEDHGATASAIAGALQALAAGEELSPQLRRLCARLQGLWATIETRQQPL